MLLNKKMKTIRLYCVYFVMPENTRSMRVFEDMHEAYAYMEQCKEKGYHSLEMVMERTNIVTDEIIETKQM